MSIDLSTEELIKIAQQGQYEEKKDSPLKSSVRRFIQENSITDGASPVPVFLIYYKYCKVWCPAGTKESKIGFFREFNKIFKRYRKAKVRYYLLNEDAFDLSPEDHEKAKKFSQNKAGKSKVSGATETPKS